MSVHPVYDLKTISEIQGQQNILSPKLVFTKKLLHKASIPGFDDYLKEGKVCFYSCIDEKSQSMEQYQNCLETCLMKWKNIHEYMANSMYWSNLVSTPNSSNNTNINKK